MWDVKKQQPSEWIFQRLNIDVCVSWRGARKEYKRNEKSPMYFSPISILTKKTLPYMKKFPAQQQELRRKIAAWKKSRVRKYTIFFICFGGSSRYKFRIREETGIFPNCWVPCFFHCNSFFSAVPLRHKTIFFRFFHSPSSLIQCEKIFC